ncbi:hypothetical protein [Streptomyces sp. N35]|uniref:hypothetical protein n=1 Tax=Streptomyces sp. N35 TaxID=2795730 RepID=UPI001F36C050|nr:hypothetical protein [Streptomyces sp. N35]
MTVYVGDLTTTPGLLTPPTADGTGTTTPSAWRAANVTGDLPWPDVPVVHAPPVIDTPTDRSRTGAKVRFIGRCEPGVERVLIEENGRRLKEAWTDSEGHWKYTASEEWSPGTHRITVEARSMAGKSHPASVEFEVLPGVAVPAPGETVNGDVRISGTAPVGSTQVVLHLDGEPYAQVKVGSNGRWWLRRPDDMPPMTAGRHLLTATTVTGSIKTPLSEVAFNVADTDTAPRIRVPAPGAIVGPRPVVYGTAPGAASVRLLVNGTDYAQVRVGKSGSWWLRLKRELADWQPGTHRVTAVAQYGDGGTAESVPIDFTVRATPGTASLESPASGSVVGSWPRLHGRGPDASNRIRILRNGVPYDEVAIAPDGSWNCEAQENWPPGRHEVTLTVIGPGGSSEPFRVEFQVAHH